MSDIDPVMKQTFLKDYNDYLVVIKAMEMNQLEVDVGIEQCTSLVDDIIDDIFIMDQEAHDLFIVKRNEISLKNKEDKESRRLGMKEPVDSLDERNQKRLILIQYDLSKHRKLLGIIKQIAYSKGWFR
jgi:hypothetical protein